MNASASRVGVWYAVAAYSWWGFAPFYFAFVTHVPAVTVLGHRILWSVVLLGAITTLRGQWPAVKTAARNPRLIRYLMCSTTLVACNWLVFIYSIASNRLIDASLGYFMNPLVTVLLGLVFLRERLRGAQWISAGLVVAGITYLAIAREGLPWIAVVLAVSFALYGLIRKQAPVNPTTGLFVETMLLFPLAIGYLAWSHGSPEAASFNTPGTLALLSLSGIVTVAPLLWFVAAAQRLPLVTIGFLQYLAPSLQFITAVAIFREPFDVPRAVAFVMIWLALGLFVADSILKNRARRAPPVPTLE